MRDRYLHGFKKADIPATRRSRLYRQPRKRAKHPAMKNHINFLNNKNHIKWHIQ